MKKKKNNIINLIFILIGTVVWVFDLYLLNFFDCVTIEQLVYSATTPATGTSLDVILRGALYIIPRIIIITCAVIFILFITRKILGNKYILKLKIKNKIHTYNILTFSKKRLRTFSILYMILVIFISAYTIGLFEYIDGRLNHSTIFEKYYVDPKNVEVSFPEEKRNLIYIFTESLEAGFVSEENGGLVPKSYIPNLETLALNNTNFSNNDKIGGLYSLSGATWTIAGMVAQTSGLPIKIGYNIWNGYKYGSFLNGAYSLGNLLYDNGYNNYFAQGSDGVFEGKNNYYNEHGNFTIYDINYYKEKKYIPEDYFVWWGIEDSKLFEFSKDQILDAAKQDKPFAFYLLTNNTHFPDGYFESDCKIEFTDNAYANSYHCSDSIIYNFIKWLEKQDFYENTTIIICGDHPTMQSKVLPKDAARVVYNTIINSKINTDYSKNRIGSTFDMYPTTLAALGATIKGNKLGLGTNLYSGEKTLLEELDKDYVEKELSIKSLYYNKNILGDTYYETKK